MKPARNCIFFDDIVAEYYNNHGEKYEYILIKDLKKYLADLSKRSEVIVVTRQNVHRVTKWFIKNNLYQFTNKITNTVI